VRGHQHEALGDGDLTPEQLEGMDMWDRDVMLDERHRAVGSMLVRRAVAEIRRHRAAKRADIERVREVVRAAVRQEPWLLHEEGIGGISVTNIATRVAEQLASAARPPALIPGYEPCRDCRYWLGVVTEACAAHRRALPLTAEEVSQLRHHLLDWRANHEASARLVERLLDGAPASSAREATDELRRLTHDEIVEVRDSLLAKGEVGALSVQDQDLLRDCDIALGVVRCAPEWREMARARILLAISPAPGGSSTP
jgi:hypothetical protein